MKQFFFRILSFAFAAAETTGIIRAIVAVLLQNVVITDAKIRLTSRNTRSLFPQTLIIPAPSIFAAPVSNKAFPITIIPATSMITSLPKPANAVEKGMTLNTTMAVHASSEVTG